MEKILFNYFILCVTVLCCFTEIRADIYQAPSVTSTDTVIQEIPRDSRGRPSLSYLSDVESARNLKLDTLQNGFDSLQIRIWYGYARNDSGQLVILKRTNDRWSAELFNLVYNLNKKGDSLISIDKTVVHREPRSGWRFFAGKLFRSGIMTLPDMRSISNYPDIADGNGVSVEVSTKDKYRYYVYQEPAEASTRVKEAADMEYILRLIEDQLHFKRLKKF